MATQTRIFIHLSKEDQYGPLLCPGDADVVDCTRRILQSQDRETFSVDCNVCFQLPKAPSDLKYALLLVSAIGRKQRTVHVYVVEMKEEAVSLGEIRRFVYAVYGPSSFDRDTLRPYDDKDDENPSEKAYTKGSVFRATCTNHQKTIEAPKDQPVMSPSEESSFSSSSSASREGPITSQSLMVTAAECDQGQKAHPLVFNTHTEDKTSLAIDQSTPTTMNEFKEEEKAVNSAISKSEMVVPQLHSQKGVFIGVPLPTHPHVQQAKMKKTVEKDNDSVSYTSLHIDNLEFAKDEEKTDETGLKMLETAKKNSPIIQKRINFFENCFKTGTHKRPASSTRMEGRIKTHLMAQRFQKQVHRERCLDPVTTKMVKNGNDAQLDVSCKGCTPDVCQASAQLPNTESEEEIMNRVHALEHMYNGECFMKAGCRKPPREESFQTVLRLKEAHGEGVLGPEAAKLFKEYILAHCERCSDVNCKVPHMAAGCPHPARIPQNSSDGQRHKQKVTTSYSESASMTKMPVMGNIAQCGSLDVGCKVPSTPGGRQASAQLLSSESKEEKIAPVSSQEELMDKAHILEHVYNKDCFMKANCKNQPDAWNLQKLLRMAEAHSKGTLDHKATELFKEYISTHCERCSDVNCKVPHMAAGCPHPGMPQNLDPYHLNFTDGQQVVAQATDNDSPNPKNMLVYLKSTKQPQESQESQTDSSMQVSEEPSDQEWIKNGNFPPLNVISKQPNEYKSLDPVLIYCSRKLTELTGLKFGSCIAYLFEETDYLGRGGHGKVYEWSFYRSHHKFASKHTHYRPQELKNWSQLDHENVISLYGVGLLRKSASVFQLMPCMTGSFQKEIDKFGTLHSLVCARKLANKPIEIIFKNTYYVFQGTAAGLSYLHDNRLVHGDIKASNILISKPPTCCCLNTLLCTCQYNVLISDFDSVGDDTTGPLRDRIVVLHSGTLFYRSPEAHFNNRGPWCDTWSIGCSINHLILGRSSCDDKIKENDIDPRKPTDTYSSNYPLILLLEANDPRELLVYLKHNLCRECPEFDQLVRVTGDSLILNYKRRITAPSMHERFSTLLQCICT